MGLGQGQAAVNWRRVGDKWYSYYLSISFLEGNVPINATQTTQQSEHFTEKGFITKTSLQVDCPPILRSIQNKSMKFKNAS